MIRPAVKDRLHPRNRFRAGYDFTRLCAVSPELTNYVAPNAYGDASIDYADPAAVKALNKALLKSAYALDWDVPPGFLCPPIPGRSDYLLHLSDLLDSASNNHPSRVVHVLDIGTGANCIYPLIGAAEFGWRFVATDVDADAVAWARRLVSANPAVAGSIECRHQLSPRECFAGVVYPGETFDLTMCNPPFHASAQEAAEGSLRKRRHLGANRRRTNSLNFAGRAGELWCDGGELAFVQRMIAQSAERPSLSRWFTTLVSKSAHLPRLEQALRDVHATRVSTIDMSHGQKKSRILAWTFQS